MLQYMANLPPFAQLSLRKIWAVDMDILFERNPSDLAPNLSPNLVGVPALLAAVSFGACKTLQYFSLTGHAVNYLRIQPQHVVMDTSTG